MPMSKMMSTKSTRASLAHRTSEPRASEPRTSTPRAAAPRASGPRPSARRTTRIALAALAASALTLTATGCGGSSDDKADANSSTSASSTSGLQLPDLHGQKLEVAAVWTGPEQANFQKVLDESTSATGASSTFVRPATASPPSWARRSRAAPRPTWPSSPRTACSTQFADKGWLKPLGPGSAGRAQQELLARLAETRFVERQAVRRVPKVSTSR